MEPLRRISSFWNWLPAFRAVGETLHLPTAGKALHVSPSALSRSIGLLERDLQVKLFRRASNRMELTSEGAALLQVVRDAMRSTHDGLLSLRSEECQGVVRIGSAGPITTAFVVPALEILREKHPKLIAHVRNDDSDVLTRLLSGEIDVSFQSKPVRHLKLACTRLGSVTSGVYCGEGHALYRKRRVALNDLQDFEFVAPIPSPLGEVQDGWPASIPRRFGAHVDRLLIGGEVCCRGRLLAVLPDVIGSGDFGRRRLRRLPLKESLSTVDLFAIHRTILAKNDRVTSIVSVVTQVIEEVTTRSESPKRVSRRARRDG